MLERIRTKTTCERTDRTTINYIYSEKTYANSVKHVIKVNPNLRRKVLRARIVPTIQSESDLDSYELQWVDHYPYTTKFDDIAYIIKATVYFIVHQTGDIWSMARSMKLRCLHVMKTSKKKWKECGRLGTDLWSFWHSLCQCKIIKSFS